MSEVPIEQWASRLESALEGDGPLRRVFVVRETESTQDAARRLDARPADVVVAWRQTAGRGRLGRAWSDPENQGVAATFVLDVAAPERLTLASAVGAAEAAESLLRRSVGIKWPNDIVADGRKLTGILIERTDGRAYIGIGMNVGQTQWPGELADRAVSLAQLGARVDRVEALEALLGALDRILCLPDDRLVERFCARDVLTGTQATFLAEGRRVTGTVLGIDPVRGLVVRTGGGDVRLPAATTTVLAAGAYSP